MAKKRTLNLCKLRPDRFRDMTSDQLMTIWARLGASAPAHRKVNQKVKALVVALAVAKNQRALANRRTPEHRVKSGQHDIARDSAASYEAKSTRLIQEIYDLQAKAGCKLSATEFVARDAERGDRGNDARRLRRKAIIR